MWLKPSHVSRHLFDLPFLWLVSGSLLRSFVFLFVQSFPVRFKFCHIIEYFCIFHWQCERRRFKCSHRTKFITRDVQLWINCWRFTAVRRCIAFWFFTIFFAHFKITKLLKINRISTERNFQNELSKSAAACRSDISCFDTAHPLSIIASWPYQMPIQITTVSIKLQSKHKNTWNKLAVSTRKMCVYRSHKPQSTFRCVALLNSVIIFGNPSYFMTFSVSSSSIAPAKIKLKIHSQRPKIKLEQIHFYFSIFFYFSHEFF